MTVSVDLLWLLLGEYSLFTLAMHRFVLVVLFFGVTCAISFGKQLQYRRCVIIKRVMPRTTTCETVCHLRVDVHQIGERKHARYLATKNRSKQASKQASNQASKQALFTTITTTNS